jgi:hypothetical protein
MGCHFLEQIGDIPIRRTLARQLHCGRSPELEQGAAMAEQFDTSRIEWLAETIGLSIPPGRREGVALNFARIAAMADLVLDCELPEANELAPIFAP